MEEIPMYSAYDICQHQGCQCQSCGNDQGGTCLADTGDCAGAREQGRCPIRICPMWRARE